MRWWTAICVVFCIQIINKLACGYGGQYSVANGTQKISSTDLSLAYQQHDLAPVWTFTTVQTARIHFTVVQYEFSSHFCTFEFGDGPIRSSSSRLVIFGQFGVASDVRSVHNSAWLAVRFNQYYPRKHIPNVEIKVDSESGSMMTSPAPGVDLQDPGTTTSRDVTSRVTRTPSNAPTAMTVTNRADSAHHGQPENDADEKADMPIDLILIIIFFSTTFALLIISLHWLHQKFRRPHVYQLRQRTSAENLFAPRATPLKIPLTGKKDFNTGMKDKPPPYTKLSENICVVDVKP